MTVANMQIKICIVRGDEIGTEFSFLSGAVATWTRSDCGLIHSGQGVTGSWLGSGGWCMITVSFWCVLHPLRLFSFISSLHICANQETCTGSPLDKTATRTVGSVFWIQGKARYLGERVNPKLILKPPLGIHVGAMLNSLDSRSPLRNSSYSVRASW